MKKLISVFIFTLSLQAYSDTFYDCEIEAPTYNGGFRINLGIKNDRAVFASQRNSVANEALELHSLKANKKSLDSLSFVSDFEGGMKSLLILNLKNNQEPDGQITFFDGKSKTEIVSLNVKCWIDDGTMYNYLNKNFPIIKP